MKKLLILTCTISVLSIGAFASDQINDLKAGIEKKQPPQIEKKAPDIEQIKKIKRAHDAAFEQKLGLTEVQKLKARELRKASHAKMEPVIKDIKAKKQEAEMVRNSKLTVEAQEEKLKTIDKELSVLRKQMQEIRKQNMKEFESILTKDQKKILKNMKKEGRKNFEEHRKELPPPPPLKKEVK